MINAKFELNLVLSQIQRAIKFYNLKTGFDGRFTKGKTPWNKDTKGLTSANKTSFKKGDTPINHKPVGSERVDVDGYTLVKVAEPNKWKLKHRVLWEKENGKIPKGYTLIFADRDKSNIKIDNLILISRHKLLIMNNNNLIKNDKELTKTGLIIADLYKKIAEK